jgi:hypothetical protein
MRVNSKRNFRDNCERISINYLKTNCGIILTKSEWNIFVKELKVTLNDVIGDLVTDLTLTKNFDALEKFIQETTKIVVASGSFAAGRTEGSENGVSTSTFGSNKRSVKNSI